MKLKNKKIAVFAEHHYQDMELWYPVFRLREEGAKVMIVGTGSANDYVGKYGYPAKVDITADKLKGTKLDGLIIPGGWAPDKLRMFDSVLTLVRETDRAKKPIGCICHGGWVLCSAGVARGRKLTSYSAIKDDLINAGANWLDAEVVTDKNLITSRKPDDLPAFMKAFIELFK